MRRLRARNAYANVMATIAVFIALGGSSYAALQVTGKNVPRDALTGADIKKLSGKDVTDNSLSGTDVKDLTSADIADGRLLAKDFASGQLPKGAKGAKGDKGDPGAPGATDVIVRSETYSALPTNQFRVNRVMCEAGERAVGGGAGMTTNAGAEEIQQSFPAEGDGSTAETGDMPAGWWSIIKNYSNSAQAPVAYVICARP